VRCFALTARSTPKSASQSPFDAPKTEGVTSWAIHSTIVATQTCISPTRARLLVPSQGATLDIGEWLTSKNGRTPAVIVIVSVGHLDDEERALVLGVLFEEVLSWVRTLPGSQRLRALVVFDEVYGFLLSMMRGPMTRIELQRALAVRRGG